jgi:glycosyltransferase involved in cell wall biosynthesis
MMYSSSRQDPLLSVVIPHFERSRLLEAALSSVLASSDRRFDVVVVDDGSCEEEWKRVQSLQCDRVKVMQRQSGHKGPGRCRNIGVASSSADYIIFLDSDDIMAPWCIERRLEVAAGDPQAGFWVFPVLHFRDQPGDENRLWNRMQTSRDDVTRFASSDPPWHTSSPIWRRTALIKFGGFNERVFYGDDSDLHLRALLSGQVGRKYPHELPDVFVRRSDTPRITNTLNDAMVESRLVRLSEGTTFLKNAGIADSVMRQWEAEYFREAEFLLFNHSAPAGPVRKVLHSWRAEFKPATKLRALIESYFAIALASRRSAYTLLRISRRIAMKLLPAVFFALGSDDTPVIASDAVMSEVRHRMAAYYVTAD